MREFSMRNRCSASCVSEDAIGAKRGLLKVSREELSTSKMRSGWIPQYGLAYAQLAVALCTPGFMDTAVLRTIFPQRGQ